MKLNTCPSSSYPDASRDASERLFSLVHLDISTAPAVEALSAVPGLLHFQRLSLSDMQYAVPETIACTYLRTHLFLGCSVELASEGDAHAPKHQPRPILPRRPLSGTLTQRATPSGEPLYSVPGKPNERTYSQTICGVARGHSKQPPGPGINTRDLGCAEKTSRTPVTPKTRPQIGVRGAHQSNDTTAAAHDAGSTSADVPKQGLGVCNRQDARTRTRRQERHMNRRTPMCLQRLHQAIRYHFGGGRPDTTNDPLAKDFSQWINRLRRPTSPAEDPPHIGQG
ncbi:hypothetical protein BDW02DRAFT_583402 [Decorospora gaudefroyi]|uniref:Uncharacterized protein n=1 Tax=Decorospora gaudefroyi TaxID=184978 RepID=A0A6A5JZ63_9PLEO|nr:hypothetical protein BDW02DRAFT_583402 [Decorospora gaudefroyi]